MINKILLYSVFLMLIHLSAGCISEDQFTKNLPAKKIDLPRYLGIWYEISRFPAWFEKDLVGVSATYSLKNDKQIEVRNQGYLNKLSGEKKVAIGQAWVPNPKEPGRLKVSFFWPFSADYVVFEVDDNYQYALVSSGKEYLWILSRTPELDQKIYNDLMKKAETAGFDISKLEKVLQN